MDEIETSDWTIHIRVYIVHCCVLHLEFHFQPIREENVRWFAVQYSASDFHILSTWLFGYCGVILKYVDNLSPRRQSESESGGIYRKCGEYQINPHQIQKHKMVRINRKKRNSVYSRLIGVSKKSQIKSAKLDLHQTNCKEMQKLYFSSLHIFY